MNRADALRKVRACLARAKSAGPAEAGIAMRQARALMDQHGLSEAEAADLTECRAKTRSRGGDLPQSLLQLAAMIADGFGCRAMVNYRPSVFTHISFFGAECDVEVATYSFTVMRRMLERDRAAHTKRMRKRATKAVRGEAFALAWVFKVAAQFPPAPISPERKTELTNFVKSLATDGKAKERSRSAKGINTTRDQIAGARAGQSAILHKGVRGNSPLTLSNTSAEAV